MKSLIINIVLQRSAKEVAAQEEMKRVAQEEEKYREMEEQHRKRERRGHEALTREHLNRDYQQLVHGLDQAQHESNLSAYLKGTNLPVSIIN